MVFVHGYSLNLDCWHFQRAAYRGQMRTVFYDQRATAARPAPTEEHCTHRAARHTTCAASSRTRVPGTLRARRPLDGRDERHLAGRAAIPSSSATRSSGSASSRPRPAGSTRAGSCSRWCRSASADGWSAAPCARSYRGHKVVDVARTWGTRVGRRDDRPLRLRRRRRRAGPLRRVRLLHAQRHAVRGRRRLLPGLRDPRQVRPPRGAGPGADGRSSAAPRTRSPPRPQPQAAQPDPGLEPAGVRGRRPHGASSSATSRSPPSSTT